MRHHRWWVVGLLAFHALLVAWGAWRHAPAIDEIGHLPAGISHWKFGQFPLYKVNPPLVRMVAAVPVLLSNPELEWHGYFSDPFERPAFLIGREFIEINGLRSFELFTWARLACLPFTLLGGYFCYRWAYALYGEAAGVLACGAWCFAPNILAHAQLMTPDLGATAVGLAACYAFRSWLNAPSWGRSLLVGGALGLTLLTKFTWVILIPVWPTLWIAARLAGWKRQSARHVGAELAQLGLVFLVGLYVLNLGYGFEGTGRRLGEYEFISPTLSEQTTRVTGNRFRDSMWASLPVPLPENCVLGIDFQKCEFDQRQASFLAGEWRQGGWWYYYVYAMAIKMPLGTWLLLLLAGGAAICSKRYRANWHEELQILLPAAVILVFVSSQTGFNHHLRYVLSAFPFLFIYLSRLGRAFEGRKTVLAVVTAFLFAWGATSSLWAYPHSLSYFNELVGGPHGGHWHLNHSNTDWGQDLLFLKKWADRHAESAEMGLALDYTIMDPQLLGLPALLPPPDPAHEAAFGPGMVVGPQPGWYAVSVNQLHSRTQEYRYFQRFDRVASVGYSVYIYHLQPSDIHSGGE